MDTTLAPAVADILRSAAARDPPDGAPAAGRSTADRRVDGDERAATDGRDLAAALAAAEQDGRTPVIAEIKPTSPTTDGERDDDPVALAEELVAGGAAAISVLTEPTHFGGSPDALRRVRAAVDVPVLRKDFVLQEAELDRVATDAVLLIARFLDTGDGAPVVPDNAGEPARLADLVDAARDRGMAPLVETHTAAEVRAAVDAGASLIGVNNRDLAALAVDLGTVERVAPHVPDDATLVAESGITTAADARRMRAAGADGLLIGSAIMDGDVRANVERFAGAEAVEQ
jgi:indole-3-glycerol phosphate synthase